MIGALDLVTTVIIEDGLEKLSKDPELLEFVLCGYARHPLLLKKIGGDYIKQAMDYVIGNKIQVLPHYQPDLVQQPSISVIASGSESTKFVGEEAVVLNARLGRQQKLLPTVITEFPVSSYETNVLTVSPELKLNEILWPNILIANGDFQTKVDGISGPSTILLKDDVPEGTPLLGWKAQVGGSNRFYDLAASIDDVDVECLLVTQGEASVHRLLSLVLRHIIKSSRLLFDQMGFQEVSVQWGAMQITNQEELEFQSSYRVAGKYTDHWIQRIGQSTPDGIRVDVNTTATHPDEDKGDVDL